MSVSLGDSTHKLFDRVVGNNETVTIKNTATNGDIVIVTGSRLVLKDNQVSDNILQSMGADGQVVSKKAIIEKTNIASYDTVGVQAYSVSDIINGIISRDCNGSPRTDTFPTATDTIAAIPNCVIGSTFNLLIRNTSAIANLLTITLGAGFSSADVLTLEKGKGSYWTFIVMDTGTPTIAMYMNSNPDIIPTPGGPFTNTHSLKFTATNQKYEGTVPVGFPLLRPGAGAGASDAWSISVWYKGPTGVAGSLWAAEESAIHGINLFHNGIDRLTLYVGDIASGFVNIQTAVSSVTPDTWLHILVTYDGDTTGGGISFSTIKSRFKIYIDAVSYNLSGSKAGNAWNAAFTPTEFGVGDIWNFGGGPAVGQYIDELAIFDYDAQAVVSNIYNSGTPTDLANTGGVTPPTNWWRWTSSDSGASVADHVASYDLTGTNLITATNIVADVPPSAFPNIFSLKFTAADQNYQDTPPVGFPMLRAGNGAGASDAWSISFWYKGPGGVMGQIIGAQEGNNTVGIGIVILANNRVSISPGDIIAGNNLDMTTPISSVPINTWIHVLITYDGDVTGDPSATFATLSGHFKIFIDGTSQVLDGFKNGNGWVGAFAPNTFGVGLIYFLAGGPASGQYIDEVAVFDYDAQTVVSNIYNSGTPTDLANTGGVTAPAHWWRWTASDSATALADHISSYNLTGSNLIASNINVDVP